MTHLFQSLRGCLRPELYGRSVPRKGGQQQKYRDGCHGNGYQENPDPR